MGYRVGGQCFATSEKASDYQMSMVVPTITADGSLKTAVYQKGKWYYGSQEVKLSFPECDQMEPFKDGLQTGSYIAMMFVAVYAVKALIKIFEHLTKDKKE